MEILLMRNITQYTPNFHNTHSFHNSYKPHSSEKNMALLVAGKGDFNLLPGFERNAFPSYELYLRIFDDQTQQQAYNLPNRITISSIHNPTQVIVSGRPHPFNLAAAGEIGQAS